MSPLAKAALVAAVPALALAAYLTSLPWVPRAPFDVLGVGWLLMNLPLLAGWAVVALLAGAALYCWVVDTWDLRR